MARQLRVTCLCSYLFPLWLFTLAGLAIQIMEHPQMQIRVNFEVIQVELGSVMTLFMHVTNFSQQKIVIIGLNLMTTYAYVQHREWEWEMFTAFSLT
jgi:hypothetical protein